MNVKNLIKDDVKFAEYQFMVKIKADVKENDLKKLGAKKISTLIQEDSHLNPKGKNANRDNLIRLRREGEEDILFVYRRKIENKKFDERLVIKNILTKRK